MKKSDIDVLLDQEIIDDEDIQVSKKGLSKREMEQYVEYLVTDDE